jgi:hypothetical protein
MGLRTQCRIGTGRHLDRKSCEQGQEAAKRNHGDLCDRDAKKAMSSCDRHATMIRYLCEDRLSLS